MLCFLCKWDLKIHMIWFDNTHTSTWDPFDVIKCNNCWLEKTLIELDQLWKYYPQDYYSYSWWLSWMEKLIRKWYDSFQDKKFGLIQYLLSGKIIKYPCKFWWWRFLDVGCWNNSHFVFLEQYGRECAGFEVGEWWWNNDIFYGYNIYSFPQEQKYDWITLRHVLEHFDDPVWYMKAITLLMTNDWSLVVSVPNQDSWYAKLFWSYRYNRDIPRHLYNRSPKTLSILTNKVWLKIDKIYHQSLFSWANSFLLLLKNQFWFNNNLINLLRPLFYVIFLPLDLIANLFKKGDVITMVCSRF